MFFGKLRNCSLLGSRNWSSCSCQSSVNQTKTTLLPLDSFPKSFRWVLKMGLGPSKFHGSSPTKIIWWSLGHLFEDVWTFLKFQKWFSPLNKYGPGPFIHLRYYAWNGTDWWSCHLPCMPSPNDCYNWAWMNRKCHWDLHSETSFFFVGEFISTSTSTYDHWASFTQIRWSWSKDW